jgi:enoyl-CoA hydratase/carnithine racemase
MGKTAFYQQQNMKLNSAYAYTSQIMVDNMLKLDAKEGISAFIEKRHPKWQDR